MSEKKPKIELLTEPGVVGDHQWSVSVKFNYEDGSCWTGGLAFTAYDDAMFDRALQNSWEQYRPRVEAKEMVDRLKSKKKIDW